MSGYERAEKEAAGDSDFFVPKEVASDSGSFAPKEHIEQFFAYDHLPAELKEVSAQFANVAKWVVATLPRNPERTVALRKLLEAKDAAVRARLAKG